MVKFVPKLKHQRHEAYYHVFDVSISLDKYFKCIKKFILDDNINPDNEEDLQFLKDMLFETKFGNNHIYFYHFVCTSSDSQLKTLKILSKYTFFLQSMSEYFLEDMFHFLMRTEESSLIGSYFNQLSHKHKLLFLEVAKSYPHAMKKIPKIKTYIVFQ